MLRCVTLIALFSLAPLTALADLAPRRSTELGGPDVGCVPDPQHPDLEWPGDADPGAWRRDADGTVTEDDPTQPPGRPDMLPQWRLHAGHVPAIGR